MRALALALALALAAAAAPARAGPGTEARRGAAPSPAAAAVPLGYYVLERPRLAAEIARTTGVAVEEVLRLNPWLRGPWDLAPERALVALPVLRPDGGRP